mmetsp:Transcript_1109/g.1399  ORF Transcript_1109/g.1399 Transcript_1109/m.1399 type:complete len:209 (+) Transcript_1109:102-728(+)
MSQTQGSKSGSSERRGSFLARAKSKFIKTKGEEGADVETLRGKSGADFESSAKVKRGDSAAMCGCFGGSDGEPEKERYVLIKGPFCFVFSNVDAPAPKYAISLAHMKAEVMPRGSSTAVLETTLGDVDYKFLFDNEEIAKKFVSAVLKEAQAAANESVKKRLGHEHLLHKHKSVRYAESVAMKKLDDQPEAPISASEMVDAMPGAQGY